MPRWEYRIVNLSETSRKARDIDLLADAGDEGWELVAVTPNNMAYMKRPADPPAPPPRARKAPARAAGAPASEQD
jgi:hypothetical protein